MKHSAVQFSTSIFPIWTAQIKLHSPQSNFVADVSKAAHFKPCHIKPNYMQSTITPEVMRSFWCMNDLLFVVFLFLGVHILSPLRHEDGWFVSTSYCTSCPYRSGSTGILSMVQFSLRLFWKLKVFCLPFELTGVTAWHSTWYDQTLLRCFWLFNYRFFSWGVYYFAYVLYNLEE